jgi:hypothetical protein
MELDYKPRVIKPRNDLESILNTRFDDAESQENILGPYDNELVKVAKGHKEGIVKTEEVSITYGEKDKVHRCKDHPASWRL